MALTPIVPQEPTFAGIAVTYATPDNTNGNSIAYAGGDYLIHVINTNGSTRTLTFTTTQVVNGVAVKSETRTIAATTGNHMYKIAAEASSLVVGGVIQLDWSASAGVTVAVFRV